MMRALFLTLCNTEVKSFNTGLTVPWLVPKKIILFYFILYVTQRWAFFFFWRGKRVLSRRLFFNILKHPRRFVVFAPGEVFAGRSKCLKLIGVHWHQMILSFAYICITLKWHLHVYVGSFAARLVVLYIFAMFSLYSCIFGKPIDYPCVTNYETIKILPSQNKFYTLPVR